jgi:hypothetical protein
MKAVPPQFSNPLKYPEPIISDSTKILLRAIGYNIWLEGKNKKGEFNDPSANYHVSTVREFLVDYKEKTLKDWTLARKGKGDEISEYRFYNSGHEVVGDHNQASNNILLGFNDTNIKKCNISELNSLIQNAYTNKSRNFNAVNKVENKFNIASFILSMFNMYNLFKVRSTETEKRPITNPGLGIRNQSRKTRFTKVSNQGSNLGKRRKFKDSDIDQQPHKRTKLYTNLDYLRAWRSGDPDYIRKAENARCDIYLSEEAEKINSNGAQKDPKPKSPPQRASSLSGSITNNQNLSSPFNPKTGRPISAPPQQCSTLTRYSPASSQKRSSTLRGSSTSRSGPGSGPGKPLKATQPYIIISKTPIK